jgi:hypothetical protein
MLPIYKSPKNGKMVGIFIVSILSINDLARKKKLKLI